MAGLGSCPLSRMPLSINDWAYALMARGWQFDNVRVIGRLGRHEMYQAKSLTIRRRVWNRWIGAANPVRERPARDRPDPTAPCPLAGSAGAWQGVAPDHVILILIDITSLFIFSSLHSVYKG